VASRTPSNDPWAEPEPTGAAKRAAKRVGKKQAKASREKKVRLHKQIGQAYKLAAEGQPLIWLWLTLIVLGVEGAGLGIGALWNGRFVYMGVLALPFAFFAGVMFLARRAEASAYSQVEGHPGAAASVLRTIRRGWTIEEEPVALDPKTMDMIFRAVGRPGVVLVGDGNPNRLRGMLKKEHLKLARVAPGVPIHDITIGRGAGQVPLAGLLKHMRRLPRALDKAALGEVNRRIQSIGGMKLPLPKGIDPFKARPDRKALRGR
jgi:hypothetical protein